MQPGPQNDVKSPQSPPQPPVFSPPASGGGEQPAQPYVIEQVPSEQSQNSQQQPAPQMVYVARPLDPEKPEISEEVRKRHEDSKKKYPKLNLSEGEFVVSDVKRHIIGLVQIWAAVVALMFLSIAFLSIVTANNSVLGGGIGASSFNVETFTLALIVIILLNALFILGGIIATKVYQGNKFFLTNESVIQVIQHSLFSKREQTVSLANIEDASFLQTGILQHVFNYGSLRLSTEGEETTYRYNFVANPGKQVGTLNNAVEAFKNGRPVDPNDEN